MIDHGGLGLRDSILSYSVLFYSTLFSIHFYDYFMFAYVLSISALAAHVRPGRDMFHDEGWGLNLLITYLSMRDHLFPLFWHYCALHVYHVLDCRIKIKTSDSHGTYVY